MAVERMHVDKQTYFPRTKSKVVRDVTTPPPPTMAGALKDDTGTSTDVVDNTIIYTLAAVLGALALVSIFAAYAYHRRKHAKQ